MIGSSNDETNFPHKLLLSNTQVSKICKAFANGLSANIKFSKIQLSKMIQSGRFALYEFTGKLIKRLESIPKFIDNKLKNVLKNKEKIFDTIKTVHNSIKGVKSIKKCFGAGITLADNEIKDIIKVIITSQKGRFLNFLRPLMRAGLPLIKVYLLH